MKRWTALADVLQIPLNVVEMNGSSKVSGSSAITVKTIEGMSIEWPLKVVSGFGSAKSGNTDVGLILRSIARMYVFAGYTPSSESYTLAIIDASAFGKDELTAFFDTRTITTVEEAVAELKPGVKAAFFKGLTEHTWERLC